MKKKFIRSIIKLVFLFCVQLNLNAQWNQLTAFTSIDLNGISCPTKNMCYVTDINGNLWKTIDGGNNWSNIYPDSTSYPEFMNQDTGFIFYGSAGSLYKSNDGGFNWIPVPQIIPDLQYYYFQKMQDNSIFLMAQSTDTFYTFYSTDFLDTKLLLTKTYSPAPLHKSSLYAFDSLNLIGFDINNQLNISTDGGLNWTISGIPAPSVFVYSANYFNTDTVIMMNNNEIYKTIDGGLNWSMVHSNSIAVFLDLDCPSKDTCYVTGSTNFTGVIAYSYNGGANWNEFAFPNYMYFSDFQASNFGYTVGGAGDVYKMDPASVITEPGKDDFINIFPNPASGILHFTLVINHRNSILKTEITDILGKKSETKIVFKNHNTIDISQFSAGIYTLNIYTSSGVISKKFVKE